MKKSINLALCVLVVAVSCQSGPLQSPYEGAICRLEVAAIFPEGYEGEVHEGIAVTAEEVNLGFKYRLLSDALGKTVLSIPKGIYRLGVSDMIEEGGESYIFNGALDKVSVSGDASISIPLLRSKAGLIVIKEIYCGGCSMYPQEGTYQGDKYVILHNNSTKRQYLDSLCIGTLFPYNSASTSPFVTKDAASGESVFAPYVPIPAAVLQIGGDGTSFPLESGEDAVVCLSGAIDHTLQYPLSVDLNNEKYFALYNETYFPNTSSHPAPGDKIQEERLLKILSKMTGANAYVVSINSPAFVLYRAKGMAMEDFLCSEGGLIDIPGNQSAGRVATIPSAWVMDAVEVFNGASSSNFKRLSPLLDAGYVALSKTYLGHTLTRRIDGAMSSATGFEYLVDTNNSTNDFYESEIQSLHK